MPPAAGAVPQFEVRARAEQQLREIQEVFGRSRNARRQFLSQEGRTGRGSQPFGLAGDQYPLYSKADEALWMEGDSFVRMGPRFKPKGGEAYQKLVKD
jgi:outer membrane protein assembly factor BamD